MDAQIDGVVAALDALKAHVRAEVDALQQGVLTAAAEATAQAFHARATRLEQDIQVQIDAVKAARMLGVASSALAGLVAVPVVVVPEGSGYYPWRVQPSEGDGIFRIGEAAAGTPAFAVQLTAHANAAIQHHPPFEEALRRGLPPGRYRFIGALVREEAGATP